MTKKNVKEKRIAMNEDLCLDEIMSDRFGRYSKYIIQERALPDARECIDVASQGNLHLIVDVFFFPNEDKQE